MEGWDQLSPFALPVGLGDPSRAQVVGRDELGRPVLRGVDGQTYSLPTPAPNAQPDNALRALVDSYQATQGPPDRAGEIAAAIGRLPNALAGAVWQGVSAPGRAASGEPVTLGDAWATALDWGAMGAPMRAPEGAVRANAMRLYHGTTPEGYAGIMDEGRINAPAYLTPEYSVARDYAAANGGGSHVVEVDVPLESLLVDLDLPGGRLLSPEDAALMVGDESLRTIEDFIHRGYSVGSLSPIEILRRYGIAGLAPSAALTAAAAQQGYDLSPPDPEMNALAAYLGGL